MRDLLRRLFGDVESAEGSPEDRDDALRLATAVLLTEMRRADFSDDPAERDVMLRVLSERFALSMQQASELLERSEAASDESVSFFEFTSRLNESLTQAEKRKVIVMLWQVAFADGRLDKYEDYVVRKVADLLYVSHTELIALKHKAMLMNDGQ